MSLPGPEGAHTFPPQCKGHAWLGVPRASLALSSRRAFPGLAWVNQDKGKGVGEGERLPQLLSMAREHLRSAGRWGGPRTDTEVVRERGWEGGKPGAVATVHTAAL